MDHNPSISVVIATHNRSAFLRETLESILAQRFRDYEIILVDDGSTDDTRQMIASYGDKVRYFYQNNSGPAAARNLGVRNARGAWIAIQDSDDLATPDYLEILYGYAREHSDCGMVFANGAYLVGAEHDRETIIPAVKSRRLAEQGVGLADLFERSIVRLQAALISKPCYDAVGGHDESLRICMDLDLSFRLFMKYPLAYLDRVVFLYRKHQGNTGRNEELRLVENIRVIDKLVAEFPEVRKMLGQTTIDHRVAYRYYRLAKGRWTRHQCDEARSALRAAIALRPYALKYRYYQLRWNHSES